MNEASDWFRIRELEPGIIAIEEPHHVEQVRSFLILGTDRSILLDTGMGVADIRPVVERLTHLPVTVVNSHADWDHIGSNASFQDIRIHLTEADRLSLGYPNRLLRPWFAPDRLTGPLPDGVTADMIAISPGQASGMLDDGDALNLGDRVLKVLHCPGHSPGSIALLDATHGALFSTDIAYDGVLYATRGHALEAYVRSLRRLADLSPHLRVVYPSHNRCPIEPGLLPSMAEAMRQIANGAISVAIEPDREVYQIGEVWVYLEPEAEIQDTWN